MSDDTYFGLDGLDKKIEKYVDFDGGVFFEAGANDGVSQSNTCHFERFRGWRGVLVEPIPSQYLKCREARPGSDCVWAALAPPNWPNPFIELTYCNLMTVTNSEQTQLDTEIHVGIGQRFLHPDDKPHKFHAPARTISSILEDAGLRKIDLFSLDLEGFEAPALRGLDLLRYDVRLFCIETSNVGDVAAALGDRYRIIDKISHHDYLFAKF